MPVKLTKHFKAIERELQKADKDNRSRAAAHLLGAIKSKISKLGPSAPGEAPGMDSGALLKSAKVTNGKTTSLIGFVAPSFYAHILEFGSKTMAARPVLFPTFAEESETAKRIMSGAWVK